MDQPALRIAPVPYRIISGSTAGLDRVIVTSPGGEPWTLFRKRTRPPLGAVAEHPELPLLHAGAERATHWSSWHREIDAYASGFLERLGKDFSAPICYAIEDGAG